MTMMLSGKTARRSALSETVWRLLAVWGPCSTVWWLSSEHTCPCPGSQHVREDHTPAHYTWTTKSADWTNQEDFSPVLYGQGVLFYQEWQKHATYDVQNPYIEVILLMNTDPDSEKIVRVATAGWQWVCWILENRYGYLKSIRLAWCTFGYLGGLLPTSGLY